MAEKDAPYFSPAQTVIGVVASTVATIGGILAARFTIGDGEVAPLADLVPFLIVSMAPMLLVLAVWRPLVRPKLPADAETRTQKALFD